MQLYRENREGALEFARAIPRRRDFKAEEKIAGGVAKKQLSFTYPLGDGRIRCEDAIEYGDEIYRVKEAPAKGMFGSVVAEQDTGALCGNAVREFKAQGLTLTQCVSAAVEGSGWGYENVSADDAGTRNIMESGTNSMELLERVAEVFWVEISFSAKKKKIYLHNRIGGGQTRFLKGFNLQSLEEKTDTHGFYTRIYPIGKDGLTVGSVNAGKDYLDNTQYSREVRAFVWEDTNYTDAYKLKEAAQKKLDGLSVPKTTYTAQVLDMANIQDGYGDYAFSLGDEAWLTDPDIGVDARERIVRITRYPDAPHKNTVELSNRGTGFADMQKKLLAAAESMESASNGKIIIGKKVEGLTAQQVEGLELYYTSPITNLEIDEICS